MAKNMMVVGDRLTFWREDGSKAAEMYLDESGTDAVVLKTIHTDGTLATALSINTATGASTQLAVTVSAGAIGTAEIADSAVTVDKLADDAVDSAEIVDGAVDPVHLASGYRSLADAAPITIAATDRTIICTATSTATTVVTMTATHAGHRVSFRMIAGDADSVITLAVTGGTITLNAANEGCEIVYSGSAWTLVALTGGSTIA